MDADQIKQLEALSRENPTGRIEIKCVDGMWQAHILGSGHGGATPDEAAAEALRVHFKQAPRPPASVQPASEGQTPSTKGSTMSKLNGKVAVNGGSTVVTGAGTAFRSDLTPGSKVRFGDDPHDFVVESVESDYHFTLGSPFEGESAAGLAVARA